LSPAAFIVGYFTSVVLIGWGAAHLAPTRAVAASFGELTRDNRRILIMEWIADGITQISLGVLIVLVTVVEGADDSATHLVDRVVAAVLLVLAALTAATGARTPVVWFRVCPFVLSGAAGLLVLASLL
jgi:hypothetical protein